MPSFDLDCDLFAQAAVSDSQRKSAGGGRSVRSGGLIWGDWFVRGSGFVGGGRGRLV